MKIRHDPQAINSLNLAFPEGLHSSVSLLDPSRLQLQGRPRKTHKQPIGKQCPLSVREL